MGGLALADALTLCELLAAVDPKRLSAPRRAGCRGSSTNGCRRSPRSRWPRPRSPSYGTGEERSASTR